MPSSVLFAISCRICTLFPFTHSSSEIPSETDQSGPPAFRASQLGFYCNRFPIAPRLRIRLRASKHTSHTKLTENGIQSPFEACLTDNPYKSDTKRRPAPHQQHHAAAPSVRASNRHPQVPPPVQATRNETRAPGGARLGRGWVVSASTGRRSMARPHPRRRLRRSDYSMPSACFAAIRAKVAVRPAFIPVKFDG